MVSKIALLCVVLIPILYSLVDYFYLSKSKFSGKKSVLRSKKYSEEDISFNQTFEHLNLRYATLLNDDQFLEVVNSKQKNKGNAFNSNEIERKCELLGPVFFEKNKEALAVFK